MTTTTWRPIFGGGAMLFASLTACIGDDPVVSGGPGNASSGSTAEPGVGSSSSSSGEPGSSGTLVSSSSSSGAGSDAAADSSDGLDAAADSSDGSDSSVCAKYCAEVFGLCTPGEVGFPNDAACRQACSTWPARTSAGAATGNTLACRKHQMTIPNGDRGALCEALGDPSPVCRD